jgi:hypothetical protein
MKRKVADKVEAMVTDTTTKGVKEDKNQGVLSFNKVAAKVTDTTTKGGKKDKKNSCSRGYEEASQMA